MNDLIDPSGATCNCRSDAGLLTVRHETDVARPPSPVSTEKMGDDGE